MGRSSAILLSLILGASSTLLGEDRVASAPTLAPRSTAENSNRATNAAPKPPSVDAAVVHERIVQRAAQEAQQRQARIAARHRAGILVGRPAPPAETALLHNPTPYATDRGVGRMDLRNR
jgi:hypothetical protein